MAHCCLIYAPPSINYSHDTLDRKGYFAALYYHVTVAIRDACRDPDPPRRLTFDDPARMEVLDVIFANRYLAAYDSYRKGQPLTRSWEVSFEEAKSAQYSIMQQLMTAMNAHIDLDLGIAVAELCPTQAELEAFKHDFNIINQILASVVPLMDCKLDSLSTVYEDLSGRKIEERLLDMAMAVAREVCWSFAERLVALGPQGQQAAIALRDRTTTALTEDLILHMGPVFTAMAEQEEKDIAKIIDVLASTDECVRELQRWLRGLPASV